MVRRIIILKTLLNKFKSFCEIFHKGIKLRNRKHIAFFIALKIRSKWKIKLKRYG